MSRDLDYYRRLPYKLDVDRFEEEEDGRYYFCASYLELPAVKGVHSDRLMAIKLARELFDSYVEAQLAGERRSRNRLNRDSGDPADCSGSLLSTQGCDLAVTRT